MQPSGGWTVVKTAISNFMQDDALMLAAALAYYTSLSLAPLLVIMVSVASWVGQDAQQQIVEQVRLNVGPQAAGLAEMVLDSADRQRAQATVSAVIGIAALLLGATTVFAQLQTSLNRIWGVRVKGGRGIWNWLRKRALSLLVVLLIGGLLLASVLVGAALGAIASEGTVVWRVLEPAISLVLTILMFALIFKLLPDVTISWRVAWVGAIVTGVLFVVSKMLVGLYLSRGSVGSSYGAAGSLAVLLVWVFFASAVLFFGAELTQAYARWHGDKIVPEPHAQWLPRARAGDDAAEAEA